MNEEQEKTTIATEAKLCCKATAELQELVEKELDEADASLKELIEKQEEQEKDEGENT